MKSVVILLLDTCRYDHITPEITPNIIKISQKGLFYSNCYAGNSCTKYSMPPLLCGDDVFLAETSIMARLRRKGYKSVLIYSSPLVGTEFSKYGWDYVIDTYNRPGRVTKRRMRRLRKYLPQFAFLLIRKLYRWYQSKERYFPYSKAEVMLNSAEKLISVFGDLPLFLWVHLMDPHIPYYPKNTDLSHSDLVKLNDKILDAVHKSYSPTDEEIDISKKLYRQEISELDEAIGNFYKSIDWSNRLLIITADHGEEFGEHGDFSHPCKKLIPELQHVPLIILENDIGIIENHFSHYDFPALVYEKLGAEERL